MAQHNFVSIKRQFLPLSAVNALHAISSPHLIPFKHTYTLFLLGTQKHETAVGFETLLKDADASAPR
jgi:hypothetical protein